MNGLLDGPHKATCICDIVVGLNTISSQHVWFNGRKSDARRPDHMHHEPI